MPRLSQTKVAPELPPVAKDKTVFIQSGNHQYTQMFQAAGWKVLFNPDNASLIQFTGGEDVSPSLYGEKRHWSTGSNPDRDSREVALFDKYVGLKDFAGICRGGQFLTVVNGDALWQNVDNHAIGGIHVAKVVSTGRQVAVSSTHHQQFRMKPGSKAEVLVTAQLSLNKEAYDFLQTGLDPKGDLEALYYAESQSLCFQPHPEFFEVTHPCPTLYFDLLREKLGYV